MMVFSHSRNMHSRTRLAAGFTLIELLIVITIMLVLVGIAIPAVRTLTRSDSVREAAREVNLFIESARADAIINGFAGVWLERDPNDLNKVRRIFKVKRPPKYQGDFENVQCFVQPMTVPNVLPSSPDYRVNPLDTTRFTVYFRRAENSLFELINGNRSVRINDRIQLANHGPWYQILSIQDVAAIPDIIPGVVDPAWEGVPGFQVVVALNTLTYDSSNSYSGVTFNNYLVPQYGPSRFQIERAPQISSRDYLNLPRNTFVDLRHSGFAVEPTVDQSLLFPGERLGGNEFSNHDPTLAGTPPAAAIDKLFPVLITFRQDGSVDRVDYQVYPTIAATPQAFTPSSEFPRSNIFLLVATEPENLDPNHNSLQDLDNLWVVISRANGTVITADVLSSVGAATPGAARAAARRGARDGQNLTAN